MDGQYLIIEKINFLSLVNALVNNGIRTLEVRLAKIDDKKKERVLQLSVDTVKNKRLRGEIEFSGHVSITGNSFTAVAYNNNSSGSFGMLSVVFAKHPTHTLVKGRSRRGHRDNGK